MSNAPQAPNAVQALGACAAPCVVIPCGARKLDRPAPAAELYVGPYFTACAAAALALAGAPERVYVLSARYGLVPLVGRVLEPYDLRLARTRLDQAGARQVLRNRVSVAVGPRDPLGGYGLRHTEPGPGGYPRRAPRAPHEPVVVALLSGAYADVARAAIPDAAFPLDHLPAGRRGIGCQLAALARLRDAAAACRAAGRPPLLALRTAFPGAHYPDATGVPADDPAVAGGRPAAQLSLLPDALP